MNVLCIGDVVGDIGLDFLARHLPALKREYQIDLCIVNGENSDKSGTGLTRHGAELMRNIGADVVTSGNHCYRRTDPSFFSETDYVLCPANQPFQEPLCGMYEVDMGRYSACVINLAGVSFLEPLDSPFARLDELLAQTSARFVIVDFHAESTAEKAAFAYYADGRISAVFGTHTHVPTADAQVLPAGTGFITDV
ncbi:MAG: TIGR00282 family metallophosphoesterase, partial [Oscillospiraceae bacterium]|nr:TIGR00282 family metallophosphoesterase [Oscillospiraceae bacterium]